MSGHSKWSTIKRQKGVADTRRSAVFTKHARLIAVAAREGGKDPDHNFRLRLEIDRARAVNMPNDNIDRAIKTGAGELRGEIVKEAVYEGFGPAGVAVIVKALTDNPNRTSADLRTLFSKHGGSLGGQNSVSWMFAVNGVVRLGPGILAGRDTAALELGAIDAGAEDVREEDGGLTILTPPDRLQSVKKWLAEQRIDAGGASLEYVPATTTAISESDRERLFGLLSALDDHDDITEFFSNDA